MVSRIVAMACAVGILICSACERPHDVHFVVPDGFRGVFKVEISEAAGPVPRDPSGAYVFRVPPSGVLRVRSQDADVFDLVQGLTAEYASGAGLLAGDVPGPKAVGLHLLWGDSDGTLYCIIGTPAERDAAVAKRFVEVGSVR